MDAALPSPFFGNPTHRGVHFHVGLTQYLWVVRSFYIRRSQDSEAAIAYLKSTLSLFGYLRVPVAWWIAGVIAGIYEDTVRPGVTVDEARAAFAHAAEWLSIRSVVKRCPTVRFKRRIWNNSARTSCVSRQGRQKRRAREARQAPRHSEILWRLLRRHCRCGDPFARQKVIALSAFRDDVLLSEPIRQSFRCAFTTLCRPPFAAVIARSECSSRRCDGFSRSPAVRMVQGTKWNSVKEDAGIPRTNGPGYAALSRVRMNEDSALHCRL